MQKVKERAMMILFLIAACVSVLAVGIICWFLLSNGLMTIGKIGPGEFLLGMEWRPSSGLYGIFPMIIGSIYVTVGAMVIGIPIGLLCAVFLAYFCPKKLYKVIKPAVDLMAGIPSIVYGFFGLVANVVIEMGYATGLHREALIATAVVLFVMILIINLLFSLVKRRHAK